MKEPLDDLSYSGTLEAVKKKYGYDFSGYLTSSLNRRITRFMSLNHIYDQDKLTTTLLGDEHIFESFIQSLSVTVTELFRDPAFFASVRNNVLTRLATYPIIKIWIAGCATGEEVLSIAILLREAELLQRSIIYATDINQHSLNIARQGIYPAHDILKHESKYLASGGKANFSNYFTHHRDSILFDKSLTEKVIYSPHNLATDKSFNEFQLILCRNVIMYFNRELQDRVLSIFSESLCPFGFIGLGDKESLYFSECRSAFEEVDRKQKIYKKNISS